MKPVLTKRDFVRRYMTGEFGNRSPTWDNLLEFQAVPGSRYHIRNRIAGGSTYYDLPWDSVGALWLDLTMNHGIDGRDLYISEMAPSHLTTIQGELQCDPELYLFYNQQPLPMREGFAVERSHAWGLKAKEILKYYMNQKSLDWLEWLWEAYTSHIVEFSCYGRCWGTEPGFNTVFWEVRAY